MIDLLGFEEIPNSHTLGNCLQGLGSSGDNQALGAVNKPLPKAALGVSGIDSGH